jgi:hypothetical protein
MNRTVNKPSEEFLRSPGHSAGHGWSPTEGVRVDYCQEGNRGDIPMWYAEVIISNVGH